MLHTPTMPEPVGHSRVDVSLCPRPESKSLIAGHSVVLASVADVDFPSAVAERHQNGFSFEGTVGFLIEGISTPKVHLESPTFKQCTRKAERAGLSFGPAYASPFPLRLTPSEQTELLAMVHNDLLYRINNGLRFIGEVDKGIEKFEELREEIRLWVEVYGLKAAAPMIWAEYPGAATYFLVSAAVYEYTHGEYWDFALNAIGIPCTPIFQRYWGQRFLLVSPCCWPESFR